MTSKQKWILLIAVLAILILLVVVAAGTYWMVGPSVRCALPDEATAEAGWTIRTVVSGGVERCYYLYAPPDYDSAQQLPVVISFHGFLSNPESHGLITGWHKLAAQEGFLVAYPQGTEFPQRWDSGPDWQAQVDDVQFFRDIVTDLSEVAAVDPARIYVNGFSNGGGMAQRIGCEAADQVAAIGSVAGAVEAVMQGCTPSRPVPAMVFHGTDDPVVIYEGGEVRYLPLRWMAAALDAEPVFVGANWVSDWAEANGCDPTPKAIEAPGSVEGVRYTGCQDGADVVFYTVGGAGHTWPGGWPIPGGLGKTNKDIDATEELWAFLQQYRLEGQP
jgi:polyhydroxybutyrate depolymerase